MVHKEKLQAELSKLEAEEQSSLEKLRRLRRELVTLKARLYDLDGQKNLNDEAK